ncbi:MAG TPA: hypothetical protein VGG02_05935 [Chthoniobacterales bacterium]|jgi:hypothetical protein
MDRCIKPRPVKLSKIDAARRQIESAIWLWFVDGDIVSVHTLTSAAHRLLLELAHIWGVNSLPLTSAYLPEGRKQKKPATPTPDVFFRKAKEEETYHLCERWTELYLFDAVMAYSHLTHNRQVSLLMALFIVRFGVQREDLFAHGVFGFLEEKVSEYFNAEKLASLSKMEFLQEFLGPAHSGR